MTRSRAMMIVIGVGLFAHWPALISDSIMWDDWIMLAWFMQARPDWMLQFYNSYGITPFALSDLPFFAVAASASSTIQAAKVTYLAGVIVNALLIALISERVAHGNTLFAALAGALAVCFPALSGEGFHIAMLKYFFFIPLFLTGILMFVRVASSTGRVLAMRVCALMALLLSFSLNSLLVLFYALVPAVFYASQRGEQMDRRTLLTNARHFLVRHADFLVLPLVFWVLKQTFMARTGVYARYNKIGFDGPGILKAYGRLIPNTVRTILVDPLSIHLGVLLAAVVLIVVAASTRRLVVRMENETRMAGNQPRILFGLGFLALFGAALPYYAVGRRSFEAFGFMSRDNVLFPLGVGWIMATLFCLLLRLRAPAPAVGSQSTRFLPQRVALGALAALVVLQSVACWRNHADWQAHYAYYRSAIEKIAHDELAANASVVQLVDQLPGDRTLRAWRYPTSIWTEILSAASQNHTTRLAIPYPPDNGRFYTRDEINRRLRETEVDFMLSEIDLDGPQIRLTVSPGSGARDPIHLALAYWWARFFVPAEMPGLLDSLTRVESEKIAR